MPIDPLNPYGLTPQEETPYHPWYAHWWAIFLLIILGVVVLGGGFFGWKVYSYYKKIQSGELGPAIIRLDEKFTHYDEGSGQTMVIPFFEVITADDPQMGPPDAPITIVEFADFLCPHCAEEALVIRGIAAQYPNEVRFIFRDFPIEEMHPGAADIHLAAECAADQGKFWAFHDKVFQNQEGINMDKVKSYAAQVGLDIAEFDQCLASAKNAGEVAEDMAKGREAGVTGTPTFFFNGRKIEGAIPYSIWDELIATVLQAQQ
ncbi:thioredoxin domain-containing protein [Patescibacteria group bacterium]|nr:thioredoxin domain-containing protein [Patescibacteria group bacterium]MBU1922426.1 thioredoxin domain-containing protein [Patescibacteria group bacterium]